MIFIGIGLGIIVGAGLLLAFTKVIWHTYHGNIVETVIKIALTIGAIGLAIAAISFVVQLFG